MKLIPAVFEDYLNEGEKMKVKKVQNLAAFDRAIALGLDQ
jgi:hypothetical protein